MLNDDVSISKFLGKKIALERKKNHLSQKQLAEDICSQSMVSSIEKGNYIPNAILLSKLCQRLNISMDNAVLSNYLEIDKLDSFNKTIKDLCNEHNYSGMLEYLGESGILNILYRNEDFQVYYYYLGVAIYQYLHNTSLSIRNLRLAYNYTQNNGKWDMMTPNEILILSGIAFLETKSNNTKSGFKNFEKAYNHVVSGKYTKYDENINILYYQYGISLTEHGFLEKAIEIILDGIKWTIDHSSTYMLSELFFSLSKAYDLSNNPEESNSALIKGKTLEEIFNFKLHKTS